MALLKLNSRGSGVKALQSALNRAGTTPRLTEDGVFGGATDRAVRAFQSASGLVADGLVGTQTQTALRRATEAAKPPRRAEPDKSAMEQTPPVVPSSGSRGAPPPNVASLRLLDTARPIDTIWIHCAATPEGRDYTVADIRAWHRARGWSDIGYHYVVYRDGSVHLGRPVGQVGSHVAGHNTGSIGIVYVGGVSADGKTAKDTRTPAQRASLLWLTEALARKHGVRRVRGHNEVAAKACPSFVVANDELGRIAA